LNKQIAIIFVSIFLLFSCIDNSKKEVNKQKEENNILELRKEKMFQQSDVKNLKKEIELLKNKRDSLNAIDSPNISKVL